MPEYLFRWTFKQIFGNTKQNKGKQARQTQVHNHNKRDPKSSSMNNYKSDIVGSSHDFDSDSETPSSDSFESTNVASLTFKQLDQGMRQVAGWGKKTIVGKGNANN